jgi:hypothetical protein
MRHSLRDGRCQLGCRHKVVCVRVEAFMLLHQTTPDAGSRRSTRDLRRSGLHPCRSDSDCPSFAGLDSASGADEATVVARLVRCFTTYRNSAGLPFGISTLGNKPNVGCHLWRTRYRSPQQFRALQPQLVARFRGSITAARSLRQLSDLTSNMSF